MYGNNFMNPYGFNPATNAPNSNPYGFTPANQYAGQPQNSNITNTNKIYVSGIEDAKSRWVLPNSDYLFIDNDKPIIYQKIVDSKGQYVVKAFKLTEFDLNSAPAATPEYVLKSDFELLTEKVKELTTRLEPVSTVQGGTINGNNTPEQAQTE